MPLKSFACNLGKDGMLHVSESYLCHVSKILGYEKRQVSFSFERKKKKSCCKPLLMICFVRTNSSCTWRRSLPRRRWKTRRKSGPAFACSRRPPRLSWRIANSCLVMRWLVIKRLKSFKFVLFFLRNANLSFNIYIYIFCM